METPGTVLVTGGGGFIGSHLAQALLERGFRVRILDNFSTGRLENIASFASRVELVEGDIRDRETVRETLKGVSAVFHQAALPSVPRSFRDPVGTTSVNVEGTLVLLEESRSAAVRRFAFGSSSSVYGDTESEVKSEDLPCRPLSPYAAGKYSCELFCRLYWKVYRLPAVCLRYFNVFGPRQDPDSPYSAVIPRFISAALRGDRPVIYGDGRQSRDFTYVGNVVRGNLRVLDAPDSAWGETFNIACGERIDLWRLAGEISRLTSSPLEPTLAPARPGDVRHSRAEISKAEKTLGYRPAVSFSEGLAETVDWYRLKHFQPRP